MKTGDSYKRVEVAPGVYQCGCLWIRDEKWGDVLRECALHRQATEASVRKFERERK